MDTSRESQKAELEAKKLRNETGVLGIFSTQIWPMIATALTLSISIYAIYISVRTQNLQVELQDKQSRREEAQKHKEALSKAVELATDPQGLPDRRIAGIWQLNTFWNTPDDQVLIANVLAAELGLDDKYRFARCAAAEVIGNVEGPEAKKLGKEEEFAKYMSRILYGDRSGAIGLVIRQHLLLRSGQFNSRESSEYSGEPDPKASNSCITALDATREAIRSNWGYLRDVNLNRTDLSRIQLYEADLSGVSMRVAFLKNANFRCANLSGADLTSAKWEDADFHFAVVRDAMPKEFVEYAIKHGAYNDMTDEQWLKWRDNGFLVKKKTAMLDAKNGSRCGKDEILPVALK